ncbi:MAG: hypothetical protein LBT01_03910, partial [Spirochaetaceae bacterium]|nr:hypothetical protein [Spirochaetaceae bacterium]
MKLGHSENSEFSSFLTSPQTNFSLGATGGASCTVLPCLHGEKSFRCGAKLRSPSETQRLSTKKVSLGSGTELTRRTASFPFSLIPFPLPP